jgi:chromosome segregation ATPase
LDDNYNNFKKECKKLENENNEIKLKNKELGENIIQLNNSLITCENQIEMSKYNESILINNLNECKINLNNVNILNKDLTNTISSLNQQYSECKTNLDNYKKNYDNLLIKNSNLNTEINSITTKYNQCINNYNICKNELSYYIKLQKKLKN